MKKSKINEIYFSNELTGTNTRIRTYGKSKQGEELYIIEQDTTGGSVTLSTEQLLSILRVFEIIEG